MTDLISRQTAIDAIEKMNIPEDMCVFEILSHIEVEIATLPSAQPDPEWIPCSERLPFAECGESDNVLATCGYRGVEDTSIRWIRTLYFDGDCWCCPTGGTYDQKVYAWMPLPEPWRGDSICK